MCPNSPAQPTEPSEPSRQDASKPKQSFGNMGPDHWTQSRGDRNQEDFEYYRQRGLAPGVAEGGGPRNFYCMDCDGVIPSDPPASVCPHCGVAIQGQARRYFNWVEIDTPPSSDWLALRPYFLAALLLLTLIVAFIWWLI